MTRGQYRSVASRYHLKSLIAIRNGWEMITSSYGISCVAIQAGKKIITFHNKMELHKHIYRCRQNIKRMMDET